VPLHPSTSRATTSAPDRPKHQIGSQGNYHRDRATLAPASCAAAGLLADWLAGLLLWLSSSLLCQIFRRVTRPASPRVLPLLLACHAHARTCTHQLLRLNCSMARKSGRHSSLLSICHQLPPLPDPLSAGMSTVIMDHIIIPPSIPNRKVIILLPHPHPPRFLPSRHSRHSSSPTATLHSRHRTSCQARRVRPGPTTCSINISNGDSGAWRALCQRQKDKSTTHTRHTTHDTRHDTLSHSQASRA